MWIAITAAAALLFAAWTLWEWHHPYVCQCGDVCYCEPEEAA